MRNTQTTPVSDKYAQLLAQRPALESDDDVVFINPDNNEWQHVSMSRVTVVCDEHEPEGDRHVTITLPPPANKPDSTFQVTFNIPVRGKREDIVLPSEVQGIFDRQEARWLLSIKKQ